MVCKKQEFVSRCDAIAIRTSISLANPSLEKTLERHCHFSHLFSGILSDIQRIAHKSDMIKSHSHLVAQATDNPISNCVIGWRELAAFWTITQRCNLSSSAETRMSAIWRKWLLRFVAEDMMRSDKRWTNNAKYRITACQLPSVENSGVD